MTIINNNEAAALADLLKIAIVTEIAKDPKRRDPAFRAITKGIGLDRIDAIIEALEAGTAKF